MSIKASTFEHQQVLSVFDVIDQTIAESPYVVGRFISEGVEGTCFGYLCRFIEVVGCSDCAKASNHLSWQTIVLFTAEFEINLKTG